MSQFDILRDKATDYARENPEKVEQVSDTGLDKGDNALDTATGGKFGEQTDKAQDMADDRIGTQDDKPQ